MAVDWMRWSQDSYREDVMLAAWYRARHSQGYRRREEKQLGSSVDPETGYERSEADLLPAGSAIRGPEFVLSCPVKPDDYASAVLLRDEPDGTTTPLSDARAIGIQVEQLDPSQPPDVVQIEDDDGRKRFLEIPAKKVVLLSVRRLGERAAVEDEHERLCREHPEWHPKLRELCGREAWDEEESQAYAEMLYLFQKTMLSLAKKGWLRLEPPMKFVSAEGYDYNRELYDKGVTDSGLPWIGSVTPEGLDEAERRIAGTALARGPFWSLASASQEKRSRAMANSPWAIERAKNDAAGGV